MPSRAFPYTFALFLALLCSGIQATAQSTRVLGKVVDASTAEPIPFANIFFKGTTIGVTSNFDGDFVIETGKATDTLVASYVGYFRAELPIRQNRFNSVVFNLIRENIELSEVVITPGENPAEILLRQVIRDKSLNNKEEYPAYRYEAYTKIEFDANNISDAFMERKIFEPFRLSLSISTPLLSTPNLTFPSFYQNHYRTSIIVARQNPPKKSSARIKFPA